jgi:pyruvate dehydrogenase E1 component beta subunit
MRVASVEVSMPYARNLERLVIPNKDKVIEVVREVLYQRLLAPVAQ